MPSPKPISRRQRRELARRLWLESSGKATFAAIAKEVGASAKSVGQWYREDGWDAPLNEAKKAAMERGLVKVADSIGACFERDLRQLKLLADQIERHLTKPTLSATEIKALASAKAESTKLARLLAGESTDNHALKAQVTGTPAPHNTGFEAALAKITSGDDPDGTMQEVLRNMVEARQTLVEWASTTNSD